MLSLCQRSSLTPPLLNGCYRTEIAVYPKNWAAERAPIVRKRKPVEWYIWYRFHDPAHRDQYPNGKLVKKRDMNKFMNLQQRQTHTKQQIEIQQELIDVLCYNPITETYMLYPEPEPKPEPESKLEPEEPKPEQTDEDDQAITPDTGLLDILNWALKEVDVVPSTRKDIKSVLKYFSQAATGIDPVYPRTA